MKKKIVAILSTAAMLVTMVGITGAFADKGPASITLDFNGKSKKVANFPHHDHQAKTGDCKTCHHKAAEGATPQACKTCHHKKKGDAPAIKDAYHKNCKGCHKKEKHGPTKCNGCHKR